MKILNIFLRDKFLQNSFVLIAGNIIAGFLGYLFHLLVSRKLSIQSYGELQTLSSLLNILAVPTVAINFFIIRHSSVFYERQDYKSNSKFYHWLNKNIIILTLVFSAILIILMPFLKSYLRLNEYRSLWIIILIMALGILASTPKGILNGWQDFKNLSIYNISGASIKLLCGVTLVFIFSTVASALLGVLAGALFCYIYLVIIIKKTSQPVKEVMGSENTNRIFDSYNMIREVKKYLLPICFFSLFLSLLTSFDMLMVKNLTNPDVAGFYGAFNILSKIIFWASSSVVLVVLPMACAKNSIKEHLSKRILISANALIFLICISGLGAYFFFPEIIINLLFGSKYLPLAGNLWAFALMAMALSLLTLEANLAYARYDFNISYILLVTLILEIFFVHIFSQNLLNIALTIAIVQFFGYLASLIYNQKVFKKCQLTSPGEINP
ncbi:MAG: oligosaccharide flippase family protein [Candidatus Parcubacteria bacterium]|nr:oligosaccharide flippase family protein [Candidatus Parcubacteria bacterium]